MVLLGVRQQDTQLAQIGRETFLAPVEWPLGGWRVVNNGNLIGTTIEGSLPLQSTSLTWRDDFTTGEYITILLKRALILQTRSNLAGIIFEHL